MWTGRNVCAVLLVPFPKRIRSKLATFIAVNSIAKANVPPVRKLLSGIGVVSPWGFQTLRRNLPVALLKSGKNLSRLPKLFDTPGIHPTCPMAGLE